MGTDLSLTVTGGRQIYPVDTGNLGRNNIHKQRRRISSLSARHIEHNALKRRYPLTENNTVVLLAKEAFVNLQLMKHRYVPVCLFENCDKVPVSLFIRIADLFRRYHNLSGTEPLKPLCVLVKRSIPPILYVCQYLLNHFADLRFERDAAAQMTLQFRFLLGIGKQP